MIKSSCFNVPFDHDGRCAVWNSLSDCIVELSREEQLALQNNSLDEISPQRRSLFLEKGIITDEAEEMRSFLQRRHEDRQLRPLYFRILTTTACNARCGYCYERDFPVQSMDEDTAASVADFIVDRYKAHPLRGRLNIEWFGGEPCLNTATINTITERLIAEGIPFRCQMTSNGLLLTRPLIEGLRERELRSIQITLDAAGKEYEEIKGLPEGSFNRVLQNMDICLSCGIEVILRINYNGDSRQAEGLIDALSGHYCGKAIRPKMYIAPLYEAEEYVSAARMREIMALNERLISAQLMAFEELYSLRRRDRCFAATPWGYTLMPDGRLLNCSHNIEPQNCWGTVWDRDAENQLHRRFISDRLSEECCRCPLIPVCGGGCPAAQHGLAAMHRCIPYKSVIADILRMRLSGRQ